MDVLFGQEWTPATRQTRGQTSGGSQHSVVCILEPLCSCRRVPLEHSDAKTKKKSRSTVSSETLCIPGVGGGCNNVSLWGYVYNCVSQWPPLSIMQQWLCLHQKWRIMLLPKRTLTRCCKLLPWHVHIKPLTVAVMLPLLVVTDTTPDRS